MKTNTDIEKQLQDWQKAYRVPDRYFENLKSIPKQPKSKLIHALQLKWALAASLLLLFGLGYKIWEENARQPANTSIESQSDLFSDLTDEEIIDYFVDNFESLPYDDTQFYNP